MGKQTKALKRKRNTFQNFLPSSTKSNSECRKTFIIPTSTRTKPLSTVTSCCPRSWPMVPKTHLMSETEWRDLGVQQSQGWVHYMTHDPEPHILLFRRPVAVYGAKQNQNQAPNLQK